MRLTPEQFILSHASVPIYDPVKAHDYYLRTRKLKGRKKATPKKLTGDLANEQTDTVVRPEFRGKFIPKGSVPITKLITTERQAQVQERVTALRGKLTFLHAILAKLVAEAQGDSAPAAKKARATTSGASKTSSTASKDRKALTGSQKAEKNQKAKAQYAKDHPQAQKEQKAKERQQKIAQVKQIIKDTDAQLKAAIENARNVSTQEQAKISRRDSKKG